MSNTGIVDFLRASSNASQHFRLRPLFTGLLDIDRAHRYSRWLASFPEEVSDPDDTSDLDIDLRIAPHRAVHVALSARLGLRDLDIDRLIICLTPPQMTPFKSPEFKIWENQGLSLFQEVARNYVQLQFPKLFADNQQRLVQSYLSPSNLYNYCKFLGYPAALLNIIGLREPLPLTHLTLAARLKWLTLPTARRKFPQPREAFRGFKLPQTVYESFMALMGSCQEQFGMSRTTRYLERRYFDLLYVRDPITLIDTTKRSPIIQLQSFIRDRGGNDVKFRLLGESGRLTVNSIYIVGVYDGVQQLGQGYGTSMALAQRRAALDALCRMQLGQEFY